MKSLLVLVISLLATAAAQKLFFAKCPSQAVVPNLDVKKYLGLWYENRKYKTIFQLGGRCTTATYTDAGNGIIGVRNDQKITVIPVSVVGQAKFADPTKTEAKLTVSFTSATPFANDTSSVTASNYWVLDTDYDNYAIVWSCQAAIIANIQFLWVLTRQRSPPEAIITKVLGVITDRGLDTSKLDVSKQDLCF
ncbi:apolipoprotein D [Hyalella azteca]|uniref:Apolipoprotein D n=1 Tax=Hyalella azteca TaxID=294128 RepID=A0A8B7P904_HYAAZ|nr:apolipoprotein D [Hyalella azteca]